MMFAVSWQASQAMAANFELDPIIDSVVYTDPKIEVAPEVAEFHPRLLTIWLEALQRPEVEYQCLAAQSIAMAYREGMQGLEEATRLLISKIETPNQHPLVSQAAAHALIEMDVRDAAAQLMSLVDTNQIDIQNIVEPALARWDYAPMREVWLKRLVPAEQKTRQFRLAVRCLTVVKEANAVQPLADFARSKTAFSVVRLEAATAAGQIAESGLEEMAKTLSADQSSLGLVSRLAAVRLLAQHQTEAAFELLLQLAKDEESSIASAAWNRVNQLQPGAMVGQIPAAIKRNDPEVRHAAVQTLLLVPTKEHIITLGDMLADSHPKVRRAARESLAKLAADEAYTSQVNDILLATLENSDRWQGLEEASLLAGQLRETSVGLQLVGLLTHEKPEVNISAAWALRRLQSAVTLPGIAEYFGKQQERLRDPSLDRRVWDLQMAQLVQIVGLMKFELAESVLVKLVGRNPLLGYETRAAAIWSLGQMHVGDPDEKLVKAFRSRVTDVQNVPPEDPRVRRAAAIALGLMYSKSSPKEAESTLQALEEFYKWKPTSSPVDSACRWAVDQILEDPIPEVGEVNVRIKGWFLEPINPN